MLEVHIVIALGTARALLLYSIGTAWGLLAD